MNYNFLTLVIVIATAFALITFYSRKIEFHWLWVRDLNSDIEFDSLIEFINGFIYEKKNTLGWYEVKLMIIVLSPNWICPGGKDGRYQKYFVRRLLFYLLVSFIVLILFIFELYYYYSLPILLESLLDF